ncbi:hypothetical protein ACQY0O_006105 [Thecaphora frezii]
MTAAPQPADVPDHAWLRVASTHALASSARHHLTLRHRQTLEYHSLLIFRFPGVGGAAADAPVHSSYYCMEATCPHLGAPLENAAIERIEADADDGEGEIEDMVVVCPWHEYDFSLSTGESSHGVKACVFACQIRPDDHLWIQAPPSSRQRDTANPHLDVHSADWEIVELRPVSEAFAQSNGREDAAATLHQQAAQLSLQETTDGNDDDAVATAPMPASASSSIPPPSPAPKTLVAWAVLVLNTAEPAKKIAYTRYAAKAFRSGECKVIGGGRWSGGGDDGEPRTWVVSEAETPPQRPPRRSEEIRVRPGAEGKRGRGGTERSRIAMLHSLANIEQWAIDLAWDIIARAPRLCAEFFSTHSSDASAASRHKMPVQFFSDFIKVAEDEAKHFSLLDQRLHSLGSYFGALPVHHGLWESAMETQHSLPARLSVVSLVHESRGLDVNPMTIRKFENAGDRESVETLTTIHLDEITHVSAGHRWLTWLCESAEPRLVPREVFREEVRRNFIGRLKGPFNVEDRRKAGLEREWYENLVGEMESRRGEGVGVQRMEVPGG